MLRYSQVICQAANESSGGCSSDNGGPLTGNFQYHLHCRAVERVTNAGLRNGQPGIVVLARLAELQQVKFVYVHALKPLVQHLLQHHLRLFLAVLLLRLGHVGRRLRLPPIRRHRQLILCGGGVARLPRQLALGLPLFGCLGPFRARVFVVQGRRHPSARRSRRRVRCLPPLPRRPSRRRPGLLHLVPDEDLLPAEGPVLDPPPFLQLMWGIGLLAGGAGEHELPYEYHPHERSRVAYSRFESWRRSGHERYEAAVLVHPDLLAESNSAPQLLKLLSHGPGAHVRFLHDRLVRPRGPFLNLGQAGNGNGERVALCLLVLIFLILRLVLPPSAVVTPASVPPCCRVRGRGHAQRKPCSHGYACNVRRNAHDRGRDLRVHAFLEGVAGLFCGASFVWISVGALQIVCFFVRGTVQLAGAQRASANSHRQKGLHPLCRN
mmetsp:Transcript_22437/g.42736  ORF Transcript_22437/g.42736 Transcript_22437/m.42736 type:complete len:436 (+) Transcript_22437:559-1866(+)